MNTLFANRLFANTLFALALGICIVALTVATAYFYSTEGFAVAPDFKSQDAYKKQVKLITDAYSPLADGKRPVKEKDQIFVNFHSLGCRFTGYIGPNETSYYDPDIAVQQAVAAGCRVFVLEIDYIPDCDNDYYPTLIVRDSGGFRREKDESRIPLCNSDAYSTIRETCEKINTYAFSSSSQNASDPVVLVLYFLRQPPGAFNSKPVLDYYSKVAIALRPLQDRFLKNESTGIYHRQRQEGQLLMNKIRDYNEKVLVFSNANTSGFREKPPKASEDLDYMVNLRLSYTQTKLGVTENGTGSTFGVLQTVEDFMIIPSDRSETAINATKLKWTICLASDPFATVSQENYKKITETYGVHCVPILLHDIPANQYMFGDTTFKTYSYTQKPEALRYTKPAIVVPAEPSKKIDAKGGALAMPSLM